MRNRKRIVRNARIWKKEDKAELKACWETEPDVLSQKYAVGKSLKKARAKPDLPNGRGWL